MNKKEIDQMKGQIKNKIRLGDYITLGKMLNKNQETARTRFRRGKEDAVIAMQKIIANREELIGDYQKIKT